MKRITLVKDPQKGIGCTIKNAAGHIFVNRILEDGPIAETGVLRPGKHTMTSVPTHNWPIKGNIILLHQTNNI